MNHSTHILVSLPPNLLRISLVIMSAFYASSTAPISGFFLKELSPAGD
jgi:hypothetical protein